MNVKKAFRIILGTLGTVFTVMGSIGIIAVTAKFLRQNYLAANQKLYAVCRPVPFNGAAGRTIHCGGIGTSIFFPLILPLISAVIIGVVIIVLVAKSKKQQWRCVCGATNKKTDEFCSNCGRANPSVKQNPPAEPKQSWQCDCGTVNRETDAFCAGCGRPKP